MNNHIFRCVILRLAKPALFTCLTMLAVFFHAFPVPAQEDQNQVFFSAVQDVPVMPGLDELEDQSSSFDKAEGRIVESLAALESVSPDAVKNFYARTLPQLGWRPAGESAYERENERLQLSFETFEGRHYMKLMVGPRVP